jgi:hypothetical protein
MISVVSDVKEFRSLAGRVGQGGHVCSFEKAARASFTENGIESI